VGYVSALPSLCTAIAMIVISRSSDRTGERFWHVLVPVTPGSAGMDVGRFSAGQRLSRHGGFLRRSFRSFFRLAGVLEPADSVFWGTLATPGLIMASGIRDMFGGLQPGLVDRSAARGHLGQ
jgi:hypothetical protein